MVYVFLADGFEEVEALTAIDILRRGGVDTKSISIMNSKTVVGAHGVSVIADAIFNENDFSDAEMLVCPGGLPGATNLADHNGLTDLLKKQNESGKPIAAICAAPAKILGKHNLLKGKKATCYPGFERELIQAQPVDDIVVTDGNITTSRGPATAMPFALELLRLLAGESVAKEIKEGLLY